MVNSYYTKFVSLSCIFISQYHTSKCINKRIELSIKDYSYDNIDVNNNNTQKNEKKINENNYYSNQKKSNLYWIIPTSIFVGGGLIGTLIYFLTQKKENINKNTFTNCNNLCFSEKEKKRIVDELEKIGIKENIDFSFCPEKNKDFYVFNLSRNITIDDVKQYYNKNYKYSEQINFTTDFDNLICNIAIKDPQKFFSNEIVKNWLSDNIIGLECVRSGTIKQNNFSELFKNYSSLYYVDISKIDLSSILNMEDMFYGCNNLTSITANWQNTGNCTDISGMFYNCVSLKDIRNFTSNINVKNITNVDYLFSGCSSLKSIDLGNWYLESIISMSHLFDNSQNLTSITLPQVGNQLTDISFMFSECKNLYNISSFDRFNVINVENMNGLFYGCKSLKIIDIPNFNCEKVKSINEIFANCDNLTFINIPKISFTNITDYNNCFSGNYNLTKVCCQENDIISNLLSELWEDSYYYKNGCYNTFTKQCTINDLKLELTNKFDNLGLVENKDYFWGDLSNEDEFIVMELNDSCFLSVKNLHVHSQSIFSMINSLKKVVFLKDNTKKTVTFQDLFKDCENLQSVSFNNIETQNIADMSNVFKNCRSLTYLDLSSFDTRNVITMEGMFSGCSSLMEIKFGNTFVTSKVINMQGMFYDCSALTNINFNDKFDTSLVLTMEGMFAYCSNLENLDLTFFNTNSVLKTRGMFRDCKGLISIKFGDKFIADKVTDMSYMFFQCVKLEKLDLSTFSTKSLKNIVSMFNNCKSLNSITFGNNFDTSQVTDMNYLFFQCVKIPYLDLSNFNTKNTENMESMFNNCKSLKTINFGDNFVAQNLNNMIEMFVACPNLEEINIPNFNNTKVTSMNYCFFGCTNLKSINIPLMSLEKVKIYDNFFSSNMKNLKKVCCKDDHQIRKILYDLWGENQTVFVDGCFLNIKEQCTSKNIRDELESKFQEFGFQEKVDYFWGDLSSENGFIVVKLNNSCFLSMKNLYNENQSILADLINLQEIVFIYNGKRDITSFKNILNNCSNLETCSFGQNWNNRNITDISNMFYNCSSLTNLDLSNFDTQNVTNMSGMFSGCSSITSLDLSNFNTQNVNSMNGMFFNCYNLTILNLSNLNTQNVNNMKAMFHGCSSLTSLDLSSFNTNNLINMSWMFMRCSLLANLDLSNFNTQNVTTMENVFYCCSNLTSLNLSNFDTQNVNNMNGMFYNCSSITNLDLSNFNTKKVTNMKCMFNRCSSLTNLDLSKFNTNKVTNMNSMFNRCYNLTSLDISKFNTSNVIDMNSMFYKCRYLTKLDLSSFNTNNVTNMTSMFDGCSLLTSLDLSNFDTSNVNNMSNMFSGCSALTNINLYKFNVTKVTDMSYMFYKCSSLNSLDLSSFDNNNVTAINDIFDECNNMEEITFNNNFFKNHSRFFLNYLGMQTNLKKICFTNKKDTMSNIIERIWDEEFSYEEGCYIKELTNDESSYDDNVIFDSDFTYFYTLDNNNYAFLNNLLK